MSTPSPGALLRQARQAQGLHIAALAASLKVAPQKLELLESDQFDKLPDVAFTRALAQAVCRHLKMDAQSVLALLPAAKTAQPALERVTAGLKTPFYERVERRDPGELPGWLAFRFIVPTVILLAAVGFLFMPGSWLDRFSFKSSPRVGQVPAVSDAASAAVIPPAAGAEGTTSNTAQGNPANTVVEPIALSASVPAYPPVMMPTASTTLPPSDAPRTPAAGSAAPALSSPLAAPPVPPTLAPMPAGMLAVRAAEQQSWIEVMDANGQVLVSRLLGPGEAVGVNNGVTPLQLTVGNATGIQVRFKGKTVELRAARDNTARVELR